MSEKNHPNFHSAKFASDITASYFECLRGDAVKYKAFLPKYSEQILEFVDSIEKGIDEEVFLRNRGE